MSHLSKKITETIENEHIAQTPHWIFIIKYIFFWLLFIITAILGSLVFSLIMFRFFEADFELFFHPLPPKPLLLFEIIPFFWFLLLGCLIWIASFILKHSRKGYRMPLWLVTVINVGVSIILGCGLYYQGSSHQIEDVLANRFQRGLAFEEQQKDFWFQPDKGLLGGTIMEIQPFNMIVLEDFSKKAWYISYSPENFKIRQNFNAPDFFFAGKRIKIVGQKTGEATFTAHTILPWKKHPRPNMWNGTERK